MSDRFEKVAIYTHDGSTGGTLKHAARQLNETRWTSKLGALWDIEHAEEALSGPKYGKNAAYLSRKKAN